MCEFGGCIVSQPLYVIEVTAKGQDYDGEPISICQKHYEIVLEMVHDANELLHKLNH